jgi:prepilin-type N-terminal cleavage/methylation domain-containing protein
VVNHRTTPRHGFTLIEMLVVMAIVALLLAIATPRYFGSLDRSRTVALQENLKVLRTTIDKFYADKGRYPATLDEMVESKYLRRVPTDPVTESSQTWIVVPSQEADLPGIVDVKSGAAGESADGTRYDAL